MSYDSSECFWLAAKPKPVNITTTPEHNETTDKTCPQVEPTATNSTPPVDSSPVSTATPATTEEESKPARQKYPDEPMDFYAEVLILRNTPGSYAGAGSGQFHQYRMARRREMYRLGKMKADAAAEQERLEWEAARQSRVDKEEKRRATKAKKRQKRKRKYNESENDHKRQKTDETGENVEVEETHND